MNYFYWKARIFKVKKKRSGRPWRVVILETDMELACAGTFEAAFRKLVKFQRAALEGRQQNWCIPHESSVRNQRMLERGYRTP